MTPLAHHAGEGSLTLLLLLGGGTLTFVVAVGRAHLAAARARLTSKQRPRRRCGAAGQAPALHMVAVGAGRSVEPGRRRTTA